MTLGIVTDSASAIPAAEAGLLDVAVVPLRVAVGGHEMPETHLTPDRLVAALRSGIVVSTSQPSPLALRAAYDDLAATGADAIVSIHLSDALSGTCAAARTAAADCALPVHVIDSGSVGLGLGFAVRAAVAVRRAGPDRVAAAARACVAASTVLFYVDTLEHLRRGGRIGAAQAVFGSALSIKPILGIEAGRIVPVDKVRTAAKALDRLVDLTLGRVPAPVAVAVQHLGASDRAQELALTLQSRTGQAVEVAELGPAIGAHVGPGTLAIVALGPTP
ncbi:MAG: DegV family protein [Sporichthyaceae bacterium]